MDTTPGTVDEKFDDVLSCWIVNWVAIVVLGEDIVRNDSLSPLRFELEMRSHGK